jgi:superfamily II DNA or RNA helicase
MDKYTLIELSRRSGTKNFIYQLLDPARNISLDDVEETKSYVVAIDNGVRYCFTGNPNIVDAVSDYVIQTDRTPTKQKLINGTVKQKKWLKHPKNADYSHGEVLESWANQFVYKSEVDEYHPGLRKPQLGALHAILGHFLAPNDVATVVLPTGTGKTETMLSALVAGQCKKLLVTVPNAALRTQLLEKFCTLGVLKKTKFEIVGKDALYPIVGLINTGFSSVDELKGFIEKCNVVVTTMHIIDSATLEQQNVYVSAFSNVFIDEAHHVKAASWRKFADKFHNEKLIQFTATPFRNDGERLDGKIIFNYPLRKAQEEGYYRTINFLPIREYDEDVVDLRIAEKAIEQLTEDLKSEYQHILMARCENTARAEEVYSIYKELCPKEYNPVILYSGHPQYKENYEAILQRKTNVIVCVNMLGEGFDLPELKIAAFHDIRKSLPVTLQFAGRFTRTSRDANLGNASFIANVADILVQHELENLYEEDADWNRLLANANDGKVNNEVDYKELLDGFKNGASSVIPVSSVYPKFSAVVYKSYINGWHPENFYKGIRNYDSLDVKSYDINEKEKLLVAVMASEEHVEGIKVKDVNTLEWSYLVLFWDEKKNLLFISSSDNGSLYKDVAKNVVGEHGKEPDLISGINVFRTFYNLKRIKLRNVGLKLYMGKDIRFRMLAGRDVENALSVTELRNSEKSYVVGDGFEDGERTAIGASYKGRVWSLSGKGNILDFKRWCLEQGDKLTDEKIDGNLILKEALIPRTISKIPEDVMPFAIDWDSMLWANSEKHYTFRLQGAESYLYDTDISLREENPVVGNALFFNVYNQEKSVEFKLELFENKKNDEKYPDFKVEQLTLGECFIQYGKKKVALASFFENNPPSVYFADGSCLCGIDYIELKTPPALYDKERLIAWDWSGVHKDVESQGIAPNLKSDSIQYKVIQELQKEDFDVIYDDDNAGEIADVVTLKLEDHTINIGLYHLKFAHGGSVTSQIVNFYEVCGQAQKSSNWKYKEPEEMLGHLLRRERKKGKEGECLRYYKGDRDTLVKLLKLARKKIPVKYNIYIVQPGVSKAKVTDEILTLLGVTDSFLKERTGIDLKVITS